MLHPGSISRWLQRKILLAPSTYNHYRINAEVVPFMFAFLLFFKIRPFIVAFVFILMMNNVPTLRHPASVSPKHYDVFVSVSAAIALARIAVWRDDHFVLAVSHGTTLTPLMHYDNCKSGRAAARTRTPVRVWQVSNLLV